MNPIVVQPGRGVVVFGARTMSTDPAWAFINSRRIEKEGDGWVVMEVKKEDTETKAPAEKPETSV